jgi:hypothetical protein
MPRLMRFALREAGLPARRTSLQCDVLGSLSPDCLPSAVRFKMTIAFSTQGRSYEKLTRQNGLNDAIRSNVNFEQDIDDLLTAIRTQGLDLAEGEALPLHAAGGAKV